VHMAVMIARAAYSRFGSKNYHIRHRNSLQDYSVVHNLCKQHRLVLQGQQVRSMPAYFVRNSYKKPSLQEPLCGRRYRDALMAEMMLG